MKTTDEILDEIFSEKQDQLPKVEADPVIFNRLSSNVRSEEFVPEIISKTFRLPAITTD